MAIEPVNRNFQYDYVLQDLLNNQFPEYIPGSTMDFDYPAMPTSPSSNEPAVPTPETPTPGGGGGGQEREGPNEGYGSELEKKAADYGYEGAWRDAFDDYKAYDEEFWGYSGYVPGVFEETGWKGMLDQAKYGLSASKNTVKSAFGLMQFSNPAMMMMSILGATPGSSMNPANDENIRAGMVSIYDSYATDEFKSAFGLTSSADLLGLVDGMFGAGNSFIGLPGTKGLQATPQVSQIASYLGYNPASMTPAQLQQLALDMRVNATKSLQGLMYDMSHTFTDQTYGQMINQFNTVLGSKVGYTVGNAQLGDAMAMQQWGDLLGLEPMTVGYATLAGALDPLNPYEIMQLTPAEKESIKDKVGNVALDVAKANVSNTVANNMNLSLGTVTSLEEQYSIIDNAFNSLVNMQSVVYDSTLSVDKKVEALKTMSGLGGSDKAGSLGAGPGIESYGGWQDAHTANDPENTWGGEDGGGSDEGGGGGGYGPGERGPDTPR